MKSYSCTGLRLQLAAPRKTPCPGRPCLGVYFGNLRLQTLTTSVWRGMINDGDRNFCWGGAGLRLRKRRQTLIRRVHIGYPSRHTKSMQRPRAIMLTSWPESLENKPMWAALWLIFQNATYKGKIIIDKSPDTVRRLREKYQGVPWSKARRRVVRSISTGGYGRNRNKAAHEESMGN